MSSEIPADIRTKAEAVVDRGYNVGLIEAVSAALMSERERCAQIAEANNSWPQEGAEIAAEIRKTDA
jgi:hypothetical protein